MHATVAGIPDAESTTESGTATPLAASCAPDGFVEFAQPRPGVPKFEHGQSVVTFGSTLSPKQKASKKDEAFGTIEYTFATPAWLIAATVVPGAPTRNSGRPSPLSSPSRSTETPRRSPALTPATVWSRAPVLPSNRRA